MRQELEALKAEEAQARAAAQERARRIDALVQQLGAAPSEPSPARAVELPRPPAEVASVKPERGEVVASKGFTVRVFGTAKLDAIYNAARPQAPGNPVFLVPKFAGGFSSTPWISTPGIRRIGLAFTGPDIGKFHSGGRISAVFFDNTNLFADRNGFLLTQSYGELFNDRLEVRRGSAIGCLRSGLADGSALCRRWRADR